MSTSLTNAAPAPAFMCPCLPSMTQDPPCLPLFSFDCAVAPSSLPESTHGVFFAAASPAPFYHSPSPGHLMSFLCPERHSPPYLSCHEVIHLCHYPF
ncbi:hypothetical protein BGX38DRAFT_1235559, partial [Terfezia claveryi]